jgi:tripartite-type tricarboxylate transporter receptor subunit TctC
MRCRFSTKGRDMAKRSLLLAACAALLLAAPIRALAADGNIFQGRTITYIIATAPGGGYDTYGRLLARFMQKHMPGTRVLVRNVSGAGHIVGANTIYASRPNGLTVGMFNTGLVYNQLIGLPGVKFDLAKMSWIGKAADELRVVMVATNSGFKSFDDMLKATAPLKFAAAGVGSAAYLDSRLLDTIFPQMEIQSIAGFDGATGELAMMRRELVATVGPASSFELFVKNGNGFFALAMSSAAARRYPGVPQAKNYVTDQRSLQLLALLDALSDLGRLTAGPPGIPAAELAALRTAHDKALADPELLTEAEKINIPINPGDGDFVAARIRDSLNQTRETVALLRAAAGAP